MTKRFGASGGVAWRQLLIRSVRSSTSSTSASRPTLSALTCSTAKPGRAATWRVASTSQRGAPAADDGTARRNACTASHDNSANTAIASANPPTVMRPSLRSEATANSSAEKPAKPASSTPTDAGRSSPRSRRITRSGGTCASCSTGGSPKPSSSVSPTPRPNNAGHTLGAGSAESTSPASSATNTKCTARPSSTPSALAISPTTANSTV
ncbi:hypothetical protein X551_04648 [Methylibium sp. T29]|nr:hypothetical protein X551_04648 [Methylibium sp. T29]EWS58295.1 hypothetical protein Y694_03812 [Methylibium sp. T29-B]